MNNNCLSISIKFATTNLLLTQYRLIHKYALPRTFNIILYNLHHMLNLLMQTFEKTPILVGRRKLRHCGSFFPLLCEKSKSNLSTNFKLWVSWKLLSDTAVRRDNSLTRT